MNDPIDIGVVGGLILFVVLILVVLRSKEKRKDEVAD